MSTYAHSLETKLAAIEVICSALVLEAKNRKGRAFEVWSKAEAEAVWGAAQAFAQKHGLRVPPMEEVVAAERQASGHSDYAEKWALYVAEKILQEEKMTSDPTTMEEVEAFLKSKYIAGEIGTGLFNTELMWVVMDNVDGEITFHWFDEMKNLSELINR